MNQLSVINKPRERQRHSPQFKQQVVAACAEPGASVAGIALAHGLNANMLRKRIREHSCNNQALVSPAFVALPMASAKTRQLITDKSGVNTDSFCIYIPYQHQPVRIHWPVSQSVQCLALLRELLQ